MNKENKCLNCGKDISNMRSNAKYCSSSCINKYSRKPRINNNININSNKKCELCGVDISHKQKRAKYCCRLHKEKHYRFINRDKVRVWKKNWNKNNRGKILQLNRNQEIKERTEFGFTKKYLREYANRHKKELILLKGKFCYKCGEKKFLEIHHHKYTKNPKDWDFICINCHRLHHEPTTLL